MCVCERVLSNGRCRKVSQSLQSDYREYGQQQQAHSRVVNVFGCFSIKMYPIRNSLS